MHKPVTAVEVRLWNRRVGAVALDPRLGFHAFEYDPDFVRQGIEIAPLAMPLAQAGAPFVFTDLPTPTFKRLPAMLADALPDDFGNALIDMWMAARGVEKRAITPLDRLAYMGRRGMGALEFRPARGPNVASHTAIKLGHLVESARRVVQGQIDTDPRAPRPLSSGIPRPMKSAPASSTQIPGLSTGCSSSTAWAPIANLAPRGITAASNMPIR